MKKLILTVVMILFSFSLHAQEKLTWFRSYELEEFFYYWDVEVEVWTAEYEDGWVTINLEDFVSEGEICPNQF